MESTRLGRVTQSLPLRVRVQGDTQDTPAEGSGGLVVGSEVLVSSLGGRRFAEAAPTLRDTEAAARHSQAALTGGGVLNTEASHVWWTQRFIPISIGRGPHWSTLGYFDFYPPAAGSVVQGAFGAADVTVTALGGIPLGVWQALYAVPTVGGNQGAVTYRIVNYAASTLQVVPAHWLLIAVRNGDDGRVRWGNGTITDYWRTPDLTNSSYTHYGGVHQAALRKDGNIVHIKGLVNAPGAGTALIFTLPANYRPQAASGHLFCVMTTGGPTRMDIRPNTTGYVHGGVYGTALAAGWFSMECSFPAAEY